MPPEGVGPEGPREWLRRARSNLARAAQGQVAPDVLFEDPCFDAQQAVEKAFKALLVLKGVQVPRTHSISIPLEVQEASALTDYAVAARYPGPAEPVLLEDYEAAVATARAVVSWVSDVITAQYER